METEVTTIDAEKTKQPLIISTERWINRFLPFITRVLIVCGIVLVVALIFLFFWYAINIVFITFLGIVLSILLRGLADLLAKFTRLSPGWSLLIVMLLLLGGMAFTFVLVVPQITSQMGGLQEKLRASWTDIRATLGQLPFGKDLIQQVSPQHLESGTVSKGLQKVFSVTFETITEAVVLIFVSIFLAVDPELYASGVLRLLPMEKRAPGREILAEIGHTLRWWLAGIFFDMAVVGILTGLGLWVLRVPLALTLGLIAGLLTFIPTFGLLVSLIPAALVALTGGFGKLLSVVALFLVAHALEAYVASPLIQQKAVSVPPVVLILALFTFGALFGILGLVVAAPLTAVGLVLIKILYVEHVLGDTIKKPRQISG
jgi:predicted PurR-regulated permease PerM